VAADKPRRAAAAAASRGARLASYLQARSDDERAGLARELHDNLGGLLVAAKIDLNHMERDRSLDQDALAKRVGKVRDLLDAAITLNRRLIEALQPGLLVHIGLYAALRWYVEDACVQAGRTYTLSLPREEVALKPAARLALYRVAQDGLSHALSHGGPEPLVIELIVHDDVLEMSFRSPPAKHVAGEEPVVLSMRHRIAGLGGTLVSNGSDGAGLVSVRLPLGDQML
jgi:signal transduction histidine kinase